MFFSYLMLIFDFFLIAEIQKKSELKHLLSAHPMLDIYSPCPSGLSSQLPHL